MDTYQVDAVTARKRDLLQLAFNIAAPHLLKQMAKSMEAGINGICLYRGPSNLKCAIGSIIADDVYTPELEGLSPQSQPDGEHIKTNAIRQDRIDKLHGAIAHGLQCDAKEIPMISIELGVLQGVHDSYEPKKWRKQLTDYASLHQLDTACMPSA